jgi:hypothetical protein
MTISFVPVEISQAPVAFTSAPGVPGVSFGLIYLTGIA